MDEALAKFPAGVAPDYCFMNRRALEQLRRSRTKVTSARDGSLIPVCAIEGQRPGDMPAQGSAPLPFS